MDALRWNAGSRAKVVFMVAILVQGFLLSTVWAYYEKKSVHPEAYTSEELAMAIEEYQSQVKVLGGQIQNVKKDMDWLVLKINRIADSGRRVPSQLKSSVLKKQKRIQVLTKEKKRVETVLGRYQKTYAAKQAKNTVAATPAPKPKVMKPIATATPVQKFRKAAQNTQPSFDKGKLAKIEAAIKKAGLEDWLEVIPTDDGCAKLENTLPILFSSGSAALAMEYKTFFKKLAGFLKSYDVKVYVNGYADPDPIKTDKYPSNFELGRLKGRKCGPRPGPQRFKTQYFQHRHHRRIPVPRQKTIQPEILSATG
jgi:flagellar motor protein MotB